MKPNDNPDIAAQYEALGDAPLRRMKELARALAHLLEVQKVPLAVPIEGRVKTLASVKEKLARGIVRVSELTSLDDLVGVRAITLFRHDADRICRAIEANFTVLKANSSDDRLNADQFGYRSVHYVLGLPLAKAQAAVQIRAEVQVRTLSEHLWASSSHILQYKKETSVPLSLRRSINRVSALLEVVDAELERLREEHRRALDERDAVPMYLEEDTLSIMLLQELLEELITDRNVTPGDDYFGILIEMLHVGVDTKAKARAVIADHIEAARKREQTFLEGLLTEPTVSVSEKATYRTAGVFLTKTGLVRYVLQIAFGDAYRLFDSRKMIDGGS